MLKFGPYLSACSSLAEHCCNTAKKCFRFRPACHNAQWLFKKFCMRTTQNFRIKINSLTLPKYIQEWLLNPCDYFEPYLKRGLTEFHFTQRANCDHGTGRSVLRLM